MMKYVGLLVLLFFTCVCSYGIDVQKTNKFDRLLLTRGEKYKAFRDEFLIAPEKILPYINSIRKKPVNYGYKIQLLADILYTHICQATIIFEVDDN